MVHMPLLVWYLSFSVAYLPHIVRAEEVDFSFVERWAAIGDSFTAGIGSGNQLGNLITLDETWKCSRFSYSYPQIVNQALGSSVKDFQYLACSGDRTDGIEKQAKALKGELDLVVLTAGGNDLCLAGMIKECVFLPHSEQSCEEVLDKAQSNINNILKPNIRKVLDALEDKMRKDSIVVYNGYAPFFNTDNEDCATKQSWALLEWEWTSFWNTRVLPLTIERRKRFNALVNDINKAISEVVAEYDGKKKYRIAYSDWSEWPEIVDGQMCSPSDDTGKYPNSKQPTMQFIKPDTHLVTEHIHDEFKRSQVNISVESPDKIAPPIADVYDSILYKSPYPPVVALDHLESRDTLAPNCPGDGLLGVPFGIGLPDSFLSNFHPNQNGHETIAASTLETIAWMRAKILGKESCPVTKQDEFKCWSSDGLDWPRPYAGWERLDKSHKEFCESVQPPSNTVNWEKEEDYFTGTMEEHRYKIKLSDGAAQFSKNECLDSFKKLIFSCDTDTDSNPMSWKYGGRYVRGATTYELNPKWQRPTHKRADGMCSYKNRYLYYEYRITGKGWAGWDWGKETLLAALKGCKALTPTAFEFGYCSPIGQECFDGYDWYAAFRTTIGVNGRCMDNQNVVAKSAGGHFHKYQKDGESYDDVGCSEQ